jgi:hypothetical protein
MTGTNILISHEPGSEEQSPKTGNQRHGRFRFTSLITSAAHRPISRPWPCLPAWRSRLQQINIAASSAQERRCLTATLLASLYFIGFWLKEPENDFQKLFRHTCSASVAGAAQKFYYQYPFERHTCIRTRLGTVWLTLRVRVRRRFSRSRPLICVRLASFRAVRPSPSNQRGITKRLFPYGVA